MIEVDDPLPDTPGSLGTVPVVTVERPTLKGAVGLSELDSDLIRLLREDGRRSYRSLSQALGATQRLVQRRVDELSTAGVLSVTVVANPAVFGYHAVGIVAIRTGGRPAEDIAAEIARLDAVDYVNVTAGRFNLFAQVVARDLDELGAVTEQSIVTISGVVSVELFPYRKLHYRAGLADPPSPHVAFQRRERTIETDDLDQAILAELSADGRMPLSQVAITVGTSETQVRRRLNRLTESGAIRIVAVVNPLTHGYTTIARLAIVVAAGHRAAEVAEGLASIPAVTYVAVCTGRYDIFCEAVCMSMAELDAMLDDELQRVPGVSRCEVFLHVAPLHHRPLRPLPPHDGSRS